MTVTLKRRQQLRSKLSTKGQGFVVSVTDSGIAVLLESDSTLNTSDVPETYYGYPVTIGQYNGHTQTAAAA